MEKIDLHTHSNISSDGEFSPEKLIALCADAGVTLISLTDHNSTRGVASARRAAKEAGIRFISGTELNCQTTDGTVLHILGYGVDDQDPIFDLLENEVNEREVRANVERIPILRNLGIQIDESILKGIQGEKILVCEMLAETALVNPVNRDHLLLQPFFPGGARSDRPFVNFFWDLCTGGAAADVPVVYRPIKEITRIIQENGGIPVLAHPGISIGKSSELLGEIIANGVVGIEVYSSYHDLEMTAFYEQLTVDLNLGKTVGSDFHGRLKPDIRLGSESCNGHEAEIIEFLKDVIE